MPCPLCHDEAPLLADGTLGRHGRLGVACQMSGQPRPVLQRARQVLTFRLLAEAAGLEPGAGWSRLVTLTEQMGAEWKITRAEVEAVGDTHARGTLTGGGAR